MKKRHLIVSFLTLALMVTLIALPVAAGDQTGFPEYAETEYEQSIITIPIFTLEDHDNPVEILKLTAFMRLEREVPFRNGLGHRQFEFTIAEWELYGYSEYLDAHVTFSLSEVPVQPKSIGVSLTEETDYPAIIVYSAIYDIYFDGKRVVKNQPGVAFAKNIYEIPPRNISVAFTKPLEIQWGGGIQIGSDKPATRIPEGVYFCDGTCEDMALITLAEFKRGTEMVRQIRAGEISLK